MSIHLVRRWRRVARQWGDVAARGTETQLAEPAAADPIKVARANAYASILNECADSLERSLTIAARKAKGAVQAQAPSTQGAQDIEPCSCDEALALRAELAAVRASVEALNAMPDITISKWACDPGGHWNPVRDALRASRAALGFDVDAADHSAFDERGWLKQRRGKPQCEQCAGVPAPDSIRPARAESVIPDLTTVSQ